MNVNPWYGQPRRHAKAAKKGWRKRGHSKARRRHAGKRCKPCHARRDSRGHFTGGFSRRDLAAANANPTGLLPNPPVMYENAGIMSMGTWASFGTAAIATAFGLVVADFVDRIMATRQPADSGTTKATMPWYGRDAAAAQRMRPDAWRLGAQAAGAVIALGLAFWTRNVKFLPWALGGIALGFGSNLIMKLTTWWLMPAILPVKDPSEATFNNRMYVLEQDAVQTKVADMFAKWDTTPSLNAQQTTPVDASGKSSAIMSPLGAGNVYALGKGQGNGAAAHGAVGAQPRFVNTGRLGLCPFCKQVNGCLSNCPSLCPSCPQHRPFKMAKYPVVAGDNLTQLAALGGVRIEDVNAMNGGTPETYWVPGKTAMVPYGIAMVLEQRQGQSGSVGSPPAEPKPAEAPAAAPTPAPAAPSPEVVAQNKSSFNVQNFGLQAESESTATAE